MTHRFLAACALFVLTAAGAFAAPSALDDIKKAGVLRIGTEGTYPPFTYHDASGALTGFDVDIAGEIARRLGVKPEFVEGKWDGLIAGLDAKRYDVVANEVSVTPERQQKYAFSSPYIVSKAALIIRDAAAGIKGFSDLKGKRVAESLTSNYAALARQYGAEVVPVEGFEQAIELLLSGRVDATLNDSLSFYDFKTRKPEAPLKIAALEVKGEPAAIIMRKGEPELLAAVNKAISDMMADGTYQKISKKYFNADVSQ